MSRILFFTFVFCCDNIVSEAKTMLILCWELIGHYVRRTKG